MATRTYEQILAEASQLSRYPLVLSETSSGEAADFRAKLVVTCLEQADQLRLLEGLAAQLRRQISGRPRHGITALRGLGTEIWRGVDAQEYVHQERDGWDG
jgi:hypothetical protein